MKEFIQAQIWRCHYCWHERGYGHGGWDADMEPIIRCDNCEGNTLHHLMRVEEKVKTFDIPPWMVGMTQTEIKEVLV